MAKLTEDERLFRKIEDKIKRAIFDYGLINDGGVYRTYFSVQRYGEVQ